MLGDRLEQLVGVRHGRDDLELAVGEQPGQPVPQQHRVLGDHDSHGSSAVMTVGPPGGLSMISVPSTDAARCMRPRESGSAVRVSPAPPASRRPCRCQNDDPQQVPLRW